MEASDGWKLVISSKEPEEVVSQISLIFPAAGSLSGGELAPAGGDAQFWMEGSIRYEMDGDWLEISGGGLQHTAAGVREAAYPLGFRTLLLNVVTLREGDSYRFRQRQVLTERKGENRHD